MELKHMCVGSWGLNLQHLGGSKSRLSVAIELLHLHHASLFCAPPRPDSLHQWAERQHPPPGRHLAGAHLQQQLDCGFQSAHHHPPSHDVRQRGEPPGTATSFSIHTHAGQIQMFIIFHDNNSSQLLTDLTRVNYCLPGIKTFTSFRFLARMCLNKYGDLSHFWITMIKSCVLDPWWNLTKLKINLLTSVVIHR